VQAVHIRRGEDGRSGKGELTGEVFENGQVKAVLALPVPPLAQAKRALQRAIKSCHEVGITSVQDASANTLQMMALAELEKEGKLDLDFATHLVHAPEYLALEKKAASLKLIDRAEEFKSKHVDTRFIKMMLDGVPLPPLFSHCELDENGKPNLKKVVIDDIEEAVLKYDERGMTVKIHCTGQGSTRLALDAFAKARERNPNGPRHEVAHCNAVHPEDWKRFQPLNVTAENSPAAFFSQMTAETTGGAIDWNFQRVLEAKPLSTIGSDWFTTPTPELIHSISPKVEQVGGGDKVKGGQILCRMLTFSGAEAVGRRNETGSIEVGKKANFIVVDRDLSKGEFEGAKVVKTWFEGRLVFSRNA
jgi:predicted amidohydrolase YtcJ